MDEENANMASPPKTNRNIWMLPGLIGWAFAPAMLMAGSVLGGWYSAEGFISPGQRSDEQIGLGLAALLLGVFGMPVILYPWSAFILRKYAVKRFVVAALLGIPLTIIMCGINLVAGFTGCSFLTRVVPNEGIF